MRIRKPGRVKEGLWFLGREETGVYLLEGRQESMIISGGMSYIVPDLLQQMTDFNIDERRITKLLILHSHFDHIGIVPFLKRRLSQTEVYASERAWEILTMEKAIRTINEFSRTVARRMRREEVYSVYDLEWRDDITGKACSRWRPDRSWRSDRLHLGDSRPFLLLHRCLCPGMEGPLSYGRWRHPLPGDDHHLWKFELHPVSGEP